ncbi:MAG TPA: hypothetical protein DCR97_00800 [Deltaproteobacteria bacterium]|jgi:hypothetical protein|nr:hypothetical protein [Deltaproteobacteria bacterium]
MARKEYMVVDIVDVLKGCQRGDAIRSLARATGMGRNTAKKYVRLAYKKGFTVEGPCDLEKIAAQVLIEINARLPGPTPSKGQVFLPHKEEIKGWIENERLTLTKIHSKLTRLGLETTYSNLVKKRFSVLDREDDVVMNLPRTMVPFSNGAFRIHPVSITTCPCSKLQGTLKFERFLF